MSEAIGRGGGVRRLQHVGVVTGDLAAALRFFRDLLGLAVLSEWRSEEGRVRIAMLEAGGACLELLAFDDPREPASPEPDPFRRPGLRHLALAVDDLDEINARLVAAGVTVLTPPRPGRHFRRYLFCQGPEGVLVELVEE